MATMYYEKDAPLKPLQGKTVAIMGFGSQGHAHAQNLQDSGVKVVVGLRKGGESAKAAKKAGLTVMEPAEAAKAAQLIMMLVPDMAQKSLYESAVAPNLKAGDALFFAHGFNIHFGQIKPPADVDVCMIAPKGPGHMVRRVYQEGKGVPSLVAVYQDATGKALKIALAYGAGIGAARAGLIQTTFAEETETDLFGEQAVLCGGTSELIRAGFDTLVAAGYQPEIAYFECLHELKLIVDLIYEQGITGMRFSISETAKYGDVMSGPRIITDETRAEMKRILNEIQNGAFAKDWILENQAGRPGYTARLERDRNHPVEVVGRTLRSMMSWMKK